MGRTLIEDITYYIETFFDRLSKLWAKWRYLPWETKIKIKALLSAIVLGLAYVVYSKSWVALSSIERTGLALFALIVLTIFVSTVLEGIGFKQV